MAWAEPMPGGGWRGRYRDPAGNKQTVTDNGLGFRRKTDAVDAATEDEVDARRRAAQPKRATSAKITWAELWRRMKQGREIVSASAPTEESVIELHVIPRWGSVSLVDIEHGPVQDWVDSLQKVISRYGTPLEPGYVRRIYSQFAKVVNYALKTHPPILTASPIVGITLPKVPKKQKPYTSSIHIGLLRNEGRLRADYADATEFSLETGLRPGEVCGLHDEQFDLEHHILTVSNVYLPRLNVIRGYPKDEDIRTVPLTPRAVEIYRRRVDGRQMFKLCGVQHVKGTCNSSLVFWTMRGKPLNPELWRDALERAAERAGVAHKPTYAGRRGFATRAGRGGMDLFDLMDIMGWSDPSLAREYVQQSAGRRERLMAALGQGAREIEDAK